MFRIHLIWLFIFSIGCTVTTPKLEFINWNKAGWRHSTKEKSEIIDAVNSCIESLCAINARMQKEREYQLYRQIQRAYPNGGGMIYTSEYIFSPNVQDIEGCLYGKGWDNYPNIKKHTNLRQYRCDTRF